MRLKSLNLQGFKSFADKTCFEFHPGVTAIVGPNGCGKSNVVDAIRWVLGETSAKALRGGEMADVIFNGTDKRKPVGMGEVTLTFADCEEALKVDFNEVSLTRRVFRDGKSEYRINNRLCRLKDIQNLLMDTGIGRSAYSIMEQGKIDMLLSSKPEDRRNVFEEAAGITKFKVQKKEALRKLDYTESNLLRVSDIMTELARQRDSLQRQANKARRYRELLDDVTTLDTHLTHRQHCELAAEKEELKTSILSLQSNEEACRREIEQKSLELGQRRERLEGLEADYHELSQQQMSLRGRIHQSQDRIGVNRERVKEFTEFVKQAEQSIQDATSKFEEQQHELQTAEEHLLEIHSRLGDKRSELHQAMEADQALKTQRRDAQEKLSQLQSQHQKGFSTMANLEAAHARKLEQQEADSHRLAMLEEELTQVKDEEKSFEAELERLVTAIEEEKQALVECLLEREDLDERFKQISAEQETLRQQVRDAERAMSKTRSRLDIVLQWVEQGEGFEKGTQKVLQGLDDPQTYKNSIRGVLGTMLQVRDDQYLPGIEAALRDYMQTVLVANGTVAEAIMERLSEKQFGYATLVAEDLERVVPASRPQCVGEGIVAALDVVEADPRIQGLIDRLLGHVYMVRSLSFARELQAKHPDCAFVTEQGELVSLEGVIHGGRTSNPKASILQKQSEIRNLKEQLGLEEGVHQNLSTELAACDETLLTTQTLREDVQERLQVLKLNSSRLEDQRRLATMELKRVNSRYEMLKQEQENLEQRQESSETEIRRLEEEREGLRKEADSLQAAIAEMENELQEFSNREADSASNVATLRTDLALEEQAERALQDQRTPMAGRLEELEIRKRRYQDDIQSYQDRLNALETEIANLEQVATLSKVEIEEVEERLTQATASRREIQQEVRQFEDVLARKNQERSALQEQKGREEIRTTQLDLRLEHCAEAILERYQIDIAIFRPDAHQLLLAIESQKKRNNRARVNKVEVDEPDSEEAAEGDFNIDDEPDWAFIEASVGEMRRKLDGMGPVNLDAIQEFEETEERLQFLQEQHGDLVNSREELMQVLAKINTESRKQFSETFFRVRDNFKQMFRELFGESGKADLILLDENDPLETGIDIIAKPPGKKLQSISLLSGGERSMTAVALLFAIYMVKPSPFCVLDELDAPLDESNIARFVKMLDRFIDQSQFVIITHSKRTMSRADVMYGVTMEEFGVSKPVGMKLTSDEKAQVAEAPEVIEESDPEVVEELEAEVAETSAT